MSILVINDTHLGVRRVGGTTLATQASLREFIADSLFRYLNNSMCNKCAVAGDLFDNFSIETRDIARAIEIFIKAWLDKGKHLWLIPGNHDDSAKGNKMSHFDLFCVALQSSYAGLVHVCKTGGYAPGEGWIEVDNAVFVAHHSDQAAFKHTLELIKHTYTEGMFIFVHANFDNGFAARSDHSLNVDRELAAMITANGATLVFAHEHQARIMMEGKVRIMGNQWPSSVADCLGNSSKFGHVLTDKLEAFETWSMEGKHGFGIVDWRTLGDGHLSFEGFIRVDGDATAEEASQVMAKIAKFRSKAKAFIITNHVTIDGIAAADDDEEIVIDTGVFNLLEFVQSRLTERQYATFMQLKEKSDAS